MKSYPHGFNDGFEYLDGKAPSITTSSWEHNNFVVFYEDMENFEIIPILRIKEATKAGFVEIHPGECFDAENPNSETRRGRKMDDKSNCLMAQNDTNFMKYEGPRIINLFGKKVRVLGIRRLTLADHPNLVQLEMQRLAGIPDARQRLDGRGNQAFFLVPSVGEKGRGIMDIYKAARDRIAADFDKAVGTTPKPSDTAELRERQKREWHRKARANYVAKNRDKIREKAREYWRSKHPGCKIRGEYKHKEAA